MCSASSVPSSPSVERVQQALRRAGMDAEMIELPGAARTAQAAADSWAAGGQPHTVFRLIYPQLVPITGGIEADVSM